MTEINLDDGIDPLTTLQRMARALQVRDPGLDATLAAVAESVVSTVPAAELASVNLVTRGRFTQRVATADPARVLGAYQQQHELGPCNDAANGQVVVRVDDLTCETRWPGFHEIAVAAGVLSMLCVPLWIDDQHLGSLTLYSTQRAAFGAPEERLAAVFASYAALALADARRGDNLQTALRNRDVIGQAKGILMERHRLTADAAFELISKSSQQHNRKLADVADHLVNTGELL